MDLYKDGQMLNRSVLLMQMAQGKEVFFHPTSFPDMLRDLLAIFLRVKLVAILVGFSIMCLPMQMTWYY